MSIDEREKEFFSQINRRTFINRKWEKFFIELRADPTYILDLTKKIPSIIFSLEMHFYL